MQRNRPLAKLNDADRERARGKIELSRILHRLGDTALGLESMKSSELIAARILLDKALPNLAQVSVKSSPNMDDVTSINTPDLLMLIRAMDMLDHNSGDVQKSSNNGVPSGIRGGSDGQEDSVDGGSMLSSNVAEPVSNLPEQSLIPSDNLHNELINMDAVLSEDAQVEALRIVEQNSASVEDGGREKYHSVRGLVVQPCTDNSNRQETIGTDNHEESSSKATPAEALGANSTGESDVTKCDKATTQEGEAAPVGQESGLQSVVDHSETPEDALLRKMEDNLLKARQLHAGNPDTTEAHDTGSGEANSGQHGSRRKGNHTPTLKGSIIPPTGRTGAGKIR